MNFPDNVQWALKFVESDLEKLRLGDQINLLAELHGFFDLPDSARLVMVPYGLGLPESLTPESWKEREAEIKELQQKLKEFLAGFIQGMDASPGRSMPEVTVQTVKISSTASSPSHRANFHLDPSVDHQKARLYFSAPWQDAFLLLLSFSLWQADVDKLKLCPQCGKLFLRVRRQEYCSRKCTNAATQRDWRGKEENRERERANARYSYARKKKAKPGMKKVRVGRKG